MKDLYKNFLMWNSGGGCFPDSKAEYAAFYFFEYLKSREGVLDRLWDGLDDEQINEMFVGVCEAIDNVLNESPITDRSQSAVTAILTYFTEKNCAKFLLSGGNMLENLDILSEIRGCISVAF